MTLGLEFVEENEPKLEDQEYVFPITGDDPMFTEVPLQIVEGVATIASGIGFQFTTNPLSLVKGLFIKSLLEIVLN